MKSAVYKSKVQLNSILISLIFVVFSIFWFHFTLELSFHNSNNVEIFANKEFLNNLIYSLQIGISLYAFIKWQNARLIKLIDKLSDSEEGLKVSLDEKEVLLTEVHHRVKNNLAVINGIIDLYLFQLKNEKVVNLLTTIQIRIKSIALVHEKLYQEYLFSKINFDEYLHDLINSVDTIYTSINKKIDIAVQTIPLTLDMNKAVPLGLLVTELITNAYQDGFKERNKGILKISLEKSGEDNYKLEVKDHGIGIDGITSYRDSSSIGIKLIRTLCKQIKADLQLHNENGFGFSILFQSSQMDEG